MASLVSCSKETPFGDGDDASTMGRFLTSSLNMEVSAEENVVRAQADDAPALEDFTVDFIKEGEAAPAASYKYSELPEIVTLPVGSYQAVAYYGENPEAAWAAPYYKGESETFNITADEVTEVTNPVVCRLSNVKVSISFSEGLSAVMSADTKVSVTVGNGASLVFTKSDEGRHGYFAYVDGSNTLAARFQGSVEGYPTDETKARDNVQPGNHYKITFSLRSAADGELGTADGDIRVDATVEVVDVTGNVDPDTPTVEDDMRPVEGGNEGPDDPTPPTPDKGPQVKDATFDLNAETVIAEDTKVEFTLVSNAPNGFSDLVCVIESETLTPAELQSVGLASELHLANPSEDEMEMIDTLAGMDFPTTSDIVGQHEVPFSITGFLPMLNMLGPGSHKFIITATDELGSNQYTIRLRSL